MNQVYKIMYQAVKETAEGCQVASSNPVLYRDAPMSQVAFRRLTKQLFAQHGNDLGAVVDELVSKHGFSEPDQAVAMVQVDDKGKIHIK